MSRTPIADYALLSDCHSATLVSRDGSVDWLCFPRFDRPSVFGRILDDAGGHWSLAVAGATEASRRYLDRSMVLETTIRTPTGTARRVEAMALGPDETGHELGKEAPRVLLRRIECVEGQLDVQMEFAPRPEYGLVVPLLVAADGGVLARGGADVLALSSPGRPDLADGVARMRLRLRAGESAEFAVNHAHSDEVPPRLWTAEEIRAGIDGATAAWSSWSSKHQRYEGPWSDLVYHSGRVLQSLTYQPTGAIVAAPTTSLPEAVGGSRNWDYRYSWVRDSSFTLSALWVAACPDEVATHFAWLAHAVASGMDDEGDLQIMFGLGGEHDLTERTLPHLRGWRDSRPVRVGNGAWNQRQLDVYGELMAAAHRLSETFDGLDPSIQRFLVRVADVAAARWGETDQGIWEVRGDPRHFTYSKLMCWVALDRAIQLAPLLGAEDRVDGWERTREEIREAILTRGWSEAAGAFTQFFGSDQLDASALMIGIMGFLPADDPRMVATIEAVERGLVDERGLVRRYVVADTDDGVDGEEGTFLLCTFWLAHALALAGEIDRARAVFERAVEHANDVGLMSEEVDGATGELLGNFPQAFSHIGLINAAWAIAQGRAAPSSID